MKIKIGSQLYTYRNKLNTASDLEALFARLKEYGCTCAQWSGVKLDLPMAQVRDMAKGYDLEIPLTHTPFKRITEETDKVAEEHLELGAHTVGLGMMPIEYSSSYDKLKKFIEIANEVGEKLKPYGLKMGYHNHAKEFKEMGGKLVLEHLMDETGLEFIFDTFWCKYAGHNVTEWLKKLEGRVTDVHLKDWKKSILKFPRFQDIGKGKLDFKEILSIAEKSGTQYAYIEHDLTKNPDKTTRESMEYLKDIYLKA